MSPPQVPLFTCDYCGAKVADPCRSINQMGGRGCPVLSADVQHPPKPDSDAINPSHYSRWPMEPVEFTATNNLPWWLHNVIKYTMRFDAKDGLKDLYKARSYLDMKIRQLEGHARFWEKPVATERVLNGH